MRCKNCHEPIADERGGLTDGAPDAFVLVPCWAVKAFVEPATIQEQSRARRELAAALSRSANEEV